MQADTLARYITQRQVQDQNGRLSVLLRLSGEASYEAALAIADFYSAGGDAGRLTVVGNGIEIERSTVRADVLPPQPPPPPPPLEAPKPPPPPAPAPPPADAVLIRTGNGATFMKGDELDRYATALRAEFREVSERLDAIGSPASFDDEESQLRLQIRLDAVRGQYRQVIEAQELMRLEALRESVRD